MCLQDLAIGRRLTYARTTVVADTSVQLAFGARLNRVALIFSWGGTADGVWQIGQNVNKSMLAYFTTERVPTATIALTTDRSGVLLARDYGLLICEEIFVKGPNFAAMNLWDVYPMPDLDTAISKEVARAF